MKEIVLYTGNSPLSVQSTPADNTRKRVWQYIERKRRKYRSIRVLWIDKTPIHLPKPTFTFKQFLKPDFIQIWHNCLKPPCFQLHKFIFFRYSCSKYLQYLVQFYLKQVTTNHSPQYLIFSNKYHMTQ